MPISSKNISPGDIGAIADTEKGSANGVAELDGAGKVPSSQLTIEAMEYKGTWDASSNSPALADGSGSTGDVYNCSVAGSHDFGSGSITFLTGDWVIYNGSIWEKSPHSGAVVSVNTKTGIVVLDADDLLDGVVNAIITKVQETNFETAYTHSQVTTGNPHNLDSTDVGADSVGTASGLVSTHESTFDHDDIATNTSHSTGDGSDHADVATNTSHSSTVTGNPHAISIDDAADSGASTTTPITIGDGSAMQTSAAPTTDAQLANKKYVDDQVGTVTESDTLDDVSGRGATTTTALTIGDASALQTSAAPTIDAAISNKKYVDDQIAAIPSVSSNEGILSQAIINGNMQVSQRGNFTSAITSASGLASSKFYLDRWKVAHSGSALANSSLQRTGASISGETQLTNAYKLVGNSSGSGITGLVETWQGVENYSIFTSKTITASFWARSNLSTDFRVKFSDGSASDTESNLDTNSGDEVWRHYTITHTVGASPVRLNLIFGIFATGESQTTIPAGGYFEFTGVRLYEGTDELPALIRSYDQELSLCQRYCVGADGEEGYNPGYSVYNINGVATSIWQNDLNALFFTYATIVDEGPRGLSVVPLNNRLSHIATSSESYIFDDSATTNGGGSTNRKVTVVNSAGTSFSNVSVASFSTRPIQGAIRITQTSVIGMGRLSALITVEREIF